jgi:Fur family transcriptional regulator, ferric uptake regulator
VIASTQTHQPFTGKSGNRVSTDGEVVRFVTDALRKAGLRVTQPRLKLLAALRHRGEPTSIEQLHHHVRSSGCDLVTVYRCMAAFEDIGLVQRTYLYDGTAEFSLKLNGQPRYYVVCKATNSVEELDADTANEIRQMLAEVEERLRSRGYSDVGHRVEFLAVRAHEHPRSPKRR